ncbi:LOW QUALITY PROTEIN: hypothetical protein TorRG33x02_007270 [Trema orientale]|uniref:Uncharacterized protein n=1 Tax=Trema orientale TaxID=63057 RepID=A0A2P5G0G9_TREOI|nr:LOW QUALITY PROTEIN: hypothetical protein TorRG33x02_007270 [Trema orientale]
MNAERYSIIPANKLIMSRNCKRQTPSTLKEKIEKTEKKENKHKKLRPFWYTCMQNKQSSLLVVNKQNYKLPIYMITPSSCGHYYLHLQPHYKHQLAFLPIESLCHVTKTN